MRFGGKAFPLASASFQVILGTPPSLGAVPQAPYIDELVLRWTHNFNGEKSQQMFSTNDLMIRSALRSFLENEKKSYENNGHKVEIFEELGVQHGSTRIDYAIINGIMCGYEIKSDRDTLDRLPGQVREFSEVFDKLTLVVGKRHLYHAIHEIPEWWGILLAKESAAGVTLQSMREPQQNIHQNAKSIARLLWRKEALKILEAQNEVCGLRNKPREHIYTKLEDIFSSDLKTLKKYVSSALTSREGWRLDQPLGLCGD